MTRRFHTHALILSAARLGLLLAIVAANLTALAVGQSSAPPQATARGFVYHDQNGNQHRDAGEPGLPGIRISNGQTIVRTDAEGQYAIEIDPQDGAVFVIKPRGWTTPLSDDHLPRFSYLHKPAGSPPSRYPGVAPTGDLPEAINFPLYPQEEPDAFQVLLFGDTQARNPAELQYMADDVIAPLIGTPAAFGVTLGDIVFDDLSLFEAHNQTVALLGRPWYNVIGNHDLNYDAVERRWANESYERVYGPSYYSYDYGHVHFLALDNIEWLPAAGNEPAHYAARFGPRQLEFIRNDLAEIPAEQMVVLLMHIPLTSTHDRHDLYRLIEPRPLCLSIAGHTHTHEHHFIGSEDGWLAPTPHHHIVNVTVCGSWWSGQRNELDIPHALMSDGAPNGYSLLTFDGDRYELDFRAAGRPADYQIQPHVVGPLTAGNLAQTAVYANVFNGSPRSRVEMQIDAAESWIDMTRVLEPDPNFVRQFEAEAKIVPPIAPALPKPGVCTHLWKAPLPPDLPAGLHRIQIRTVDQHGRTYSCTKILRIN